MMAITKHGFDPETAKKDEHTRVEFHREAAKSAKVTKPITQAVWERSSSRINTRRGRRHLMLILPGGHYSDLAAVGIGDGETELQNVVTPSRARFYQIP